MPDESAPLARTTSFEKIGPLFLQELQNQFTAARAKLNRLVEQWGDLSMRQKRSLADSAQHQIQSLVIQCSELARNRGDESFDEACAEIYSWQKKQTKRLTTMGDTRKSLTFSFKLFLTVSHSLLAHAQSFLERANLLLSAEPLPPNFAQDAIKNIEDELEERIQAEAVRIQREKVEELKQQVKTGVSQGEIPLNERVKVALGDYDLGAALDEFEAEESDAI